MDPTAYLLTQPLFFQSEQISMGIDLRKKEVISQCKKQTLVRKVGLAALRALAFMSVFATIAAVGVSLIFLKIKPLGIAALSLASGLSAFVIDTYLNPKNPGEILVANYWNKLRQSLMESDGTKIVFCTQEFARQQLKRPIHYQKSLEKIPTGVVSSFNHKALVYGFLLQAMDHLEKREWLRAVDAAQKGLEHYKLSGYGPEVEHFLKKIFHHSLEFGEWIAALKSREPNVTLDFLIVNATA